MFFNEKFVLDPLLFESNQYLISKIYRSYTHNIVLHYHSFLSPSISLLLYLTLNLFLCLSDRETRLSNQITLLIVLRR